MSWQSWLVKHNEKASFCAAQADRDTASVHHPAYCALQAATQSVRRLLTYLQIDGLRMCFIQPQIWMLILCSPTGQTFCTETGHPPTHAGLSCLVDSGCMLYITSRHILVQFRGAVTPASAAKSHIQQPYPSLRTCLIGDEQSRRIAFIVWLPSPR